MIMKTDSTVFSDFLTELGVPHTVCYSNKLFDEMPFKSLFGFSKLLSKYGIPNEGYRISDKDELSKLMPPFLAQTVGGFVIVKSIDDKSVCYLTEGVDETTSLDEFKRLWSGFVLLAYPDARSAEPDYETHHREEIFIHSKKWILTAGVLSLFSYFFVSGGLYRHVSTVLLILLNILGVYLTYLLVQKSLKIANATADHVCEILEEGGCDSILEMKASKFFGLFGWSEVGFAYFTVSLLSLLLFPNSIEALALCNVFCLPFTIWSIWYQKFRARVWCTLCVCVQCTLWFMFFCFLLGGWLKTAFHFSIEFFILGIAYITALMAYNKILPLFDKSNNV